MIGTIIDRHLFRQIIMTTLIVSVVVISIDAFLGLLREGKNVSRYDSYTYADAIIYISLRLPEKLVQFLPSFTLIGCLLGLGALASNSELTAMRAAGMAKAKIVLSCMKTGLLLVVFMFCINEFLTPVSEIKAEQHRDQARGKKIVTEVQSLWVKDGNDIVFVGKANSDAKLNDIQVFDINENKLATWISIESAQLQTKNTDQDQQWLLENTKQKRFTENEVLLTHEESTFRNSLVSKDLFEASLTKPRFMSLRTLWTHISYLRENGLDDQVHVKSFWKRITAPFSILVMMLLAMPFIFVNKRAGNAGARIVIGIMIGFTYEILSSLISNAGQVYGYAALGAITPLIVASVIGLMVLKRSEF